MSMIWKTKCIYGFSSDILKSSAKGHHAGDALQNSMLFCQPLWRMMAKNFLKGEKSHLK